MKNTLSFIVISVFSLWPILFEAEAATVDQVYIPSVYVPPPNSILSNVWILSALQSCIRKHAITAGVLPAFYYVDALVEYKKMYLNSPGSDARLLQQNIDEGAQGHNNWSSGVDTCDSAFWNELPLSDFNEIVVSLQTLKIAGPNGTRDDFFRMPLNGRWSQGDCRVSYSKLTSQWNRIEVRNETGALDVERVISWGRQSLKTVTAISTSGTPLGTEWIYSSQNSQEILVKNLTKNRNFVIKRCE